MATINDLKEAAIDAVGTASEITCACAYVQALRQIADDLAERGELPSEIKNVTVGFGKHKGRTLWEVAQSDRSYLVWASENMTRASQSFMSALNQVLAATEDMDAKDLGSSEDDWGDTVNLE